MRKTFVFACVATVALACGVYLAWKFLGPSDLEPDPGTVMFDTPEADEILRGLQVFPKDNAWHWDISYYPLHPRSQRIIKRLGEDLPVHAEMCMGFVIVPPTQKRVDVRGAKCASQSKWGLLPVPKNMPIEGWPLCGGTLKEIQRSGEGERHGIVLDPGNGKLYEFYGLRLTPQGWEAKQATTWDLSSNKLHRYGYRSADMAGLPLLAGVVRYEECEDGVVKHAIRVTMAETRGQWTYPASHHGPTNEVVDLPRMGERLRLRADYDVSRFSKHAQAILLAMKKHGLIVADFGRTWGIYLTPDRRFQDIGELSRLKGSDFEVVDAAKFIPPPAKKPGE